MKICPRCKLKNLNGAAACECGYSFTQSETATGSASPPAVSRQELGPTHPGPNTGFKGKKFGPAMLSLIWLVLVGLFTAYGYFSLSIFSASQSAVACGADGIGVATIVVVGLFVLIRVRAHNLGRGVAVLLSAIASALAGILPPIVMMSSGLYSSGEAAKLPSFTGMITLVGGVLAFNVLTLCVLLVPRKEK